MDFSPVDNDVAGSFYLGRHYDTEKQRLKDTTLHYQSKDLCTHGVVLGMTGSGKTGLCFSILEEAALDGVPAIAVDPKGDIGNLILRFPELRPEDFKPWLDEQQAKQKGLSLDDYAKRTAQTWREGLAQWGQDSHRIGQLKNGSEVVIFTPASLSGIPISILSSLAAPPEAIKEDGEMLGEHIETTTASLLGLIGVDADPVQSPEAILTSNILSHCWQKGETLDLHRLIAYIQRPPFDTIGALSLESFFNSKKRQALALKCNALLASPSFETWLKGPSLDIQHILFTDDGKPRIAVFSIAHLSDSERMFFVSLLLNSTVSWMRQQTGTQSLRALFYMDEIYGYLPPIAQPPSKKPLMTILKQGRAFGLGCLLATQNPGDLDYKALSNIGTWFIGRLQTQRDRQKVLDGLATTNLELSRNALEKLLANLKGRVFLMKNIHDKALSIFHVRWVMSFLRGPLTRHQIERLMAPYREAFLPALEERKKNANPFIKDAPPSPRPILESGIIEHFAPIDGTCYYPYLYQKASVSFFSKKYKIDFTKKKESAFQIVEEGINWDSPLLKLPSSLSSHPKEGIDFSPLPGFAMEKNNYQGAKKALANKLYREEKLPILYAPLLKITSKPEEKEEDFRESLKEVCKQAFSKALQEIEEKYALKINTKSQQLSRAEHQLSKEKADYHKSFFSNALQFILGLIATFLGSKKPRRSRSSRGIESDIMTTYKEREDYSYAKEKVEYIKEAIELLERQKELDINELKARFDYQKIELTRDILTPYKKNVQVQEVSLLWASPSLSESPY